MTQISIPKIYSLNLLKIKCPECRRYFDSKNAVNVHLKKSHDSTYKIDLDSKGLVYLRSTLQTRVE